MSMQSAVLRYNPGAKLVPLYRSELARAIPVNLPPSVNYPSGQIIGQQTGSANDVQTITAPGSGTYVLSGVNPLTGLAWSTAALAFGASDATVQAAIIAAIGLGGAGVTVASLAVTFGGALGLYPVALMTTTAGSVAHTTVGHTAKTFAAYASGNSDGSQNPSLILEYPCVTDVNGNIISDPYLPGVAPSASAFFCGTFDCADLTGLDTNAVSKMNGLVIAGTVTAGTFRF